MPVHMTQEVEKLNKLILSLSTRVEDNLRNAMRSTESRDQKIALEVIRLDEEIDQVEVDVEEECLKILALHQPVAHDLRYIVAILKINNDLERISDLAVTIAERAVALTGLPEVSADLNLRTMGEKAQNMVSGSLDAMIQLDLDLARKIWFADDEVDRINEEMHERIEALIRKDPDHIAVYLNYLSVSRALERIADHASNIAKDVLYMIEGQIVRHRKRAIKEALEKQRRDSAQQ